MGKKIGILGGTFNPIHIGHLILGENAYECAELDEVWFMPTGISYLKDQKKILPSEIRAQMISMAISGNDHFRLSDCEMIQDGNSYTYKTLSILKKKNPEDDFYFIIGEDSLHGIANWKNPEIIFELATIIVAPRNCQGDSTINHAVEVLKSQFPHSQFIIMNVPELDISSSQIRDNILCKKSYRYYLPDKVYSYISENKLYN